MFNFRQSCSCGSFGDLLTSNDLPKRERKTAKIVRSLALLATHPLGEHELYTCAKCGHYWQRSLEWVSGNRPYIFKVVPIDLAEWMEKPFVQPDELFVRVGVFEQYWRNNVFDEKEALCRKDGCGNHAIRLSVFCVLHHMDSIGLKTQFPDNLTWFGPYRKDDLEPSIEFLKRQSNYVAYRP